MSSPSDNRTAWRLVLLAAFLLPFAVHWREVFPVNGGYRGIGNDFDYLYYNYKVYLLDYLSRGKVPLWSATEGIGFPFYSNPFTAILYPLNLPLVLFYNVMDGYTRLDHQVFTIAGIGIFCAGMLVWLRALGVPLWGAFAFACISGMNFKLAEGTRLPNAIHAAAWYPWALLGIQKVLLAKSNSERLKAAALLIAALFCMCTAGYPYFSYYSIFLFGPYGIALLVGVSRDPQRRPYLKKNLIWAIGALSVLGLCIAPYLYHMQSLLSQTTDRAGKSFAYSTEHVFTWADTLGSLLYPPLAQTEGWAYAGICVVAFALYYLIFAGEGRERTAWWEFRYTRLLFLGWILFVCSLTHARHSLIFPYFWNYFPGFSSLRVWGRFQIVLLPAIGLLAGLGFRELFFRVTLRSESAGIAKIIAPLVITFLIALGFQWWAFTMPFDPYWMGYHNYFSGTESAFLSNAWIVTACVLVLLLTILFLDKKLRGFGPAILACVIVACTSWEVSTWILRTWSFPNPMSIPARTKLHLVKDFQKAPITPRQMQMGLPLSESYGAAPMPNWYFDRFTKFFTEWTEKDQPSRDAILGLHDGNRFYFVSSLDVLTPKGVLDSSARWGGKVTIVRFTPESVRLNVYSPRPGYLIFIDNWDSHWRARVNEKTAEIELAFGTFKAVKVISGTNRIAFSYKPFS